MQQKQFIPPHAFRDLLLNSKGSKDVIPIEQSSRTCCASECAGGRATLLYRTQPMKWLPFLFAVASMANQGLGQSQAQPVVYYVQLIRGTDTDQSPEPKSKKVDPHLAGAFCSVFKWRSYWEISGRRVELETGRATRVRLNQEREVEIDLTNPAHRAVKAFLNGKVVQQTVCPRSETRTLIGGDRDATSAWFIVVSRLASE